MDARTEDAVLMRLLDIGESYKRAQRRAARQYSRVVQQRRDEARKWAHAVVSDHDQNAVADFNPRFLAAGKAARQAADGRIAAAKAALTDAAAKHGRELVLIPPAYTTMDCSACGARAKHRIPLFQRTYVCDARGHTADRDRNAASIMLDRAGFDPTGADRLRPGESSVPLAA